MICAPAGPKAGPFEGRFDGDSGKWARKVSGEKNGEAPGPSGRRTRGSARGPFGIYRRRLRVFEPPSHRFIQRRIPAGERPRSRPGRTEGRKLAEIGRRTTAKRFLKAPGGPFKLSSGRRGGPGPFAKQDHASIRPFASSSVLAGARGRPMPARPHRHHQGTSAPGAVPVALPGTGGGTVVSSSWLGHSRVGVLAISGTQGKKPGGALFSAQSPGFIGKRVFHCQLVEAAVFP